MRGQFWVGCALLAVGVLTRMAGAGEVKNWEEFVVLDASEQDKQAKKKVQKKGEYFFCKMGKYQVFADKDAVTAYKWGLILNDFTEALLEDGVVPKKANRQGSPMVYVLKDHDGYEKALRDYSKGQIEAGWSAGMFVPYAAKPALFAFDPTEMIEGRSGGEEKKPQKDQAGDDEKGKKGDKYVMSTILHECTHQMVYYQLGNNIPTWFNEGLAMNCETYDLAMNCKANLYNAMYVNNRALSAIEMNKSGELKKFSVLFDISGQAWNNASDNQAQVNYTSTWVALNYMLTTKNGRKRMGEMQNALKTGGENALRKLFNPSMLKDTDEAVKEFIDKVVQPCREYGVFAREALNAGDQEKAQGILAKMKEAYPDNLELKFYEQWLAILNNQEPAKAVEALKKMLATTDFFHPEANFVLALGSKAAGNQADFATYLKKAQESNGKHPGTVALAQEGKAK